MSAFKVLLALFLLASTNLGNVSSCTFSEVKSEEIAIAFTSFTSSQFINEDEDGNPNPPKKG
jgi:hypothetical protein